MEKKHLPRKNNNICRIRSLLLNINERLDVTHIDYKISVEEFEAYFIALERNGYIQLIEGETPFQTCSYIIADPIAFEKMKNNLYSVIEKIIIPAVTNLLKTSISH